MCDYESVAKSLQCCASDSEPCEHCNCELEECNPKTIMEISADAIEELLSAVPHWISVKERLPELYAPVLVAYIGYNTGLILSDMTAYRDGDGDWCWYDGDFPSGDMCKVEVTHWMPLPEPPKEE